MRLATLGSLKLPNHSIRLMATILQERGCPLDAALRAANVTSALLADPVAEINGVQELAFQQAFYELTPDQPLLWIELGARYRLLSHAHNFYGLTMATSADVQEAVETGLRFADLYYTLADGSGIYADGHLVGFRSLTTEVPAELKRFSMLRDLGMNCTVFADLWGGPFPFERVELPLSVEDDPHIRRYLPDIPITYDAECSAWYWSARLHDRRPPQSDSILHDFYTQKCQAVVAAARASGDLVERLVAMLAAAPSHMSLDDTANQLGLSARTLQRRLEQRRLSYRDLTTLGRYRAACRLLTETKTPITQIALEVGYDNVSSFNHAFRRHAGMSPRSFRRGARHPIGDAI